MKDIAILEQEIMALPLAERAMLVDRVYQTLGLEDPETTKAWVEEARDRTEAFLRGEIEAEDAEVVFARLRSHYAM